MVSHRVAVINRAIIGIWVGSGVCLYAGCERSGKVALENTQTAEYGLDIIGAIDNPNSATCTQLPCEWFAGGLINLVKQQLQSVEYLNRGDIHTCDDVMLQCLKATEVDTGGGAVTQPCISFCNAQFIACVASRLDDAAHSLTGECNEGMVCSGGILITPNARLSYLIESAIWYYNSTGVLLQLLSDPSYLVGDATNTAESCFSKYSCSTIISWLDEYSYKTLEAKIINQIDKLTELGYEAVDWTLQRADAGEKDTSYFTADAAGEWYGYDAPRSQALELLVGTGPVLWPCSIDPDGPGIKSGLKLFHDSGELLTPAAVRAWYTQNLQTVDPFEYYRTTEDAYRLAVASVAEMRMTTHTGPAQFPVFSAGFHEAGIKKGAILWRAEGGAAQRPANQNEANNYCFPVTGGVNNRNIKDILSNLGCLKSLGENCQTSFSDPTLYQYCLVAPVQKLLTPSGVHTYFAGLSTMTTSLAELWRQASGLVPALATRYSNVASTLGLHVGTASSRVAFGVIKNGANTVEHFGFQSIVYHFYADINAQTGFAEKIETSALQMLKDSLPQYNGVPRTGALDFTDPAKRTGQCNEVVSAG